MPQVNLNQSKVSVAGSRRIRFGRTYCRPTNEKVRSAIRVASVRPLMLGAPIHDGWRGMAGDVASG